MIIFVDTAYWVARIDKRDQWKSRVIDVTKQLTTAQLITTELVLVEVLNYFSSYRSEVRQEVGSIIQSCLDELDIKVVWQTQELFKSGLSLYQSRLDKGYSLTDCVSMVVMKQAGIQNILTHDHHFTQEGFTILL
jgi:predicted nucleic acid-binding protein